MARSASWEGHALRPGLEADPPHASRATAGERGALFPAQSGWQVAGAREDRGSRRGAGHHQRLDRTRPGLGCRPERQTKEVTLGPRGRRGGGPGSQAPVEGQWRGREGSAGLTKCRATSEVMVPNGGERSGGLSPSPRAARPSGGWSQGGPGGLNVRGAGRRRCNGRGRPPPEVGEGGGAEPSGFSDARRGANLSRECPSMFYKTRQ